MSRRLLLLPRPLRVLVLLLGLTTVASLRTPRLRAPRGRATSWRMSSAGGDDGADEQGIGLVIGRGAQRVREIIALPREADEEAGDLQREGLLRREEEVAAVEAGGTQTASVWGAGALVAGTTVGAGM